MSSWDIWRMNTNTNIEQKTIWNAFSRADMANKAQETVNILTKQKKNKKKRNAPHPLIRMASRNIWRVNKDIFWMN